MIHVLYRRGTCILFCMYVCQFRIGTWKMQLLEISYVVTIIRFIDQVLGNSAIHFLQKILSQKPKITEIRPLNR